MGSGVSADVDRALDGLGEVPAGIGDLVERYAGRARLTPGEADALFASFATLDQVATSLADGAAAPAQVGPSRILDQVEPARTPAPEERPGELQAGAVFETDLVARPWPEVSSQAQRSASVLETADAKDGPLTRRMDARDVRTTPVPRRAAFAAGLFGADDLPEFPLARPPNVVKEVEPEGAIEASNSASPSPEQTDSFEILVDEELLEIEPDDAEFEPADDE